MSQSNENNKNSIKLVNSKDAKSVIKLNPDNSIEKLQVPIKDVDNIEEEAKYSEDDIQKSLMSNNYEAYNDEPIVEKKEEEEEVVVPPKKKITKEDVLNYLKNMPKKIKLGLRLLGLLVCIIFVIIFIKHEIKIHTYDIVINGGKEVSLYEGGLYKENGATAYNYKGENKTILLKINADVNTEKVGKYKVTYSVKSIWKKNIVTRVVNVLPNPLDDIYFTLNGDEEINVDLNSTYEDEGYSIRSDDKEDYSRYVTTTNRVNTSKIGTYEVRYLIKINKKQQELVRKVNVVGDRYSIKYSKVATKGNVEVRITSNINNFDYFVVDGHRVLKDNIVYTVTDNGKYEVRMVDTDGKSDSINLNITNIDRQPPSGTCVATMNSKNKNTSFYMNVKDNNFIKSFTYNNKSYEDYRFTVNSIVSNGNVIARDVAGNQATISCKYVYASINPGSSNNVIMRFNGTTLKYWVEKPTSTYLITHIWVEDPYNQFKVAIPRQFPQLDRAGYIMNIASIKYGYYSKAMIGANASGFVSNVFNAKVAKRYPKWKFSSKSPLVIVDGKVLRDFSSYNMSDINATTYALNSKGYFIAYSLTTNNKNYNISSAKKIKESGAKYTFAFGPILINNGQIRAGLSNSPDVRQAIGQIDKNNFVIVTNTVGINNRGMGLGYKSLATIMHRLGCKTAYNTDGGGSTNLIYKNRNTNSYSGLVTTTREVADIMYFVEK